MNLCTYIQFHMHVCTYVGIAFSDYDEQLKLQRNISMIVLRELGYGKKSIENKIIEEAEHLTLAFKVDAIYSIFTKLNLHLDTDNRKKLLRKISYNTLLQ